MTLELCPIPNCGRPRAPCRYYCEHHDCSTAWGYGLSTSISSHDRGHPPRPDPDPRWHDLEYGRLRLVLPPSP